MEIVNNNLENALFFLLKNPFEIHTATSMANNLEITRPGMWKILNKLSNEGLINLEGVSKTKTSTIIIKLNHSNQITEKMLSLILTKEALKQQRWMANFKDLENNVHFLILFGSILNKPKEAEDIGILVITDKKSFKAIEEITLKIQKTLLKKIHFIDLTKEEFYQELKKQNKAYIDAIKKGVVLYGQDSFVQFMKDLQE